MPESEDIAITSDVIRLGQLLKFAGLAESGAHAAAIIADGEVRVNDQTETRRGRQLRPGDVVSIATPVGALELRVTADEPV
ncbi:RNA-binding S4 domain-containing protein [Aeromicrobium sp. YIM 150415]|uniref:RNA-binding S4 domain-containing protein n=1 Tax=Aeromicrobium sp. YIM 150415 TaxID=2803912 RepID=UPI0019641FC6|nr:RNA-binding S4 domain-containing protein [Aeromicrobium sp. YIM 150415]MBM9465333.1 RNA-binding S4 domain-containing protein [Aeromicrobium sp. YIM 150415]